MAYRPSPQLVAANAALVHFLASHPGQRLSGAPKQSPAVTEPMPDDGRQGAALREEGGGDGAAREGRRGKGREG